MLPYFSGSEDFPYKEGVDGSNPSGSTSVWIFQTNKIKQMPINRIYWQKFENRGCVVTGSQVGLRSQCEIIVACGFDSHHPHEVIW